MGTAAEEGARRRLKMGRYVSTISAQVFEQLFTVLGISQKQWEEVLLRA